MLERSRFQAKLGLNALQSKVNNSSFKSLLLIGNISKGKNHTLLHRKK